MHCTTIIAIGHSCSWCCLHYKGYCCCYSFLYRCRYSVHFLYSKCRYCNTHYSRGCYHISTSTLVVSYHTVVFTVESWCYRVQCKGIQTSIQTRTCRMLHCCIGYSPTCTTVIRLFKTIANVGIRCSPWQCCFQIKLRIVRTHTSYYRAWLLGNRNRSFLYRSRTQFHYIATTRTTWVGNSKCPKWLVRTYSNFRLCISCSARYPCSCYTKWCILATFSCYADSSCTVYCKVC